MNVSGAHASAKRPLLVYWGRRGALSHFVFGLAQVAGDRAVFSLSRQNELFDEIRSLGNPLVAVDTFDSYAGGILRLPRMIGIRRTMMEAIAHHHVDRVVVLMSQSGRRSWPARCDAQGALRRDRARRGPPPRRHHGARQPMAAAGCPVGRRGHDAERARRRATDRPLSGTCRPRADAFSFRPLRAMRRRRLPTRRSRPASSSSAGSWPTRDLPLFVEACEILRARGLSVPYRRRGRRTRCATCAPRLEALGAEHHQPLDRTERSGGSGQGL